MLFQKSKYLSIYRKLEKEKIQLSSSSMKNKVIGLIVQFFLLLLFFNFPKIYGLVKEEYDESEPIIINRKCFLFKKLYLQLLF